MKASVKQEETLIRHPMRFHALLFTWGRSFVALIGEDFCLTEAVNNVPLLSFSCVLQDLVRPITGGEEDTTAYGKQISARIHHAYGNGPMSWKRAVVC
ncbi:unnamed protein product [Sphagnum balticum]